MSVSVSRRSFVGSLVAAGLGLTVLGSSASPARADEVVWDEERELVIIGAGGALFAALAAKKEGHDVVVLEKRGAYGGSMFLSAGAIWIPNNNMMPEELREQESQEKCLQYLKEIDLYKTHDEGLMADWVSKCNSIYDYITESLGVPIGAFGADSEEYRSSPHDYYDYPGSACGRTVWLPTADGRIAQHSVCWSESFAPIVDESGLDIRLSTPAQRLVVDDEGAVVGVCAVDDEGNAHNIRATKGVIIATGSFDHNKQMVNAYLEPPLVGSQIPESCTGDGHIMGMEVGADIANMGYNYGCPLVDYESDMPFSKASVLNNAIIVNRGGRRFCNETASYDEVSHSMQNCDLGCSGHPYCYSGNATGVYDAEGIRWAGIDPNEPPAYVRCYDTLEELAEGEGIDVESLVDEVARYNGFCEAGVDEDFHRCEGPFDNPETGLYGTFVRLTPVATPPFFAATLGRGSLGTSGGLVVNENAQVLRKGEPIPGLYASGCAADALVCGYPGAGFPNSMAITRAMMAADHALGLGIVKAE